MLATSMKSLGSLPKRKTKNNNNKKKKAWGNWKGYPLWEILAGGEGREEFIHKKGSVAAVCSYTEPGFRTTNEYRSSDRRFGLLYTTLVLYDDYPATHGLIHCSSLWDFNTRIIAGRNGQSLPLPSTGLGPRVINHGVACCYAWLGVLARLFIARAWEWLFFSDNESDFFFLRGMRVLD